MVYLYGGKTRRYDPKNVCKIVSEFPGIETYLGLFDTYREN